MHAYPQLWLKEGSDLLPSLLVSRFVPEPREDGWAPFTVRSDLSIGRDGRRGDVALMGPRVPEVEVIDPNTIEITNINIGRKAWF